MQQTNQKLTLLVVLIGMGSLSPLCAQTAPAKRASTPAKKDQVVVREVGPLPSYKDLKFKPLPEIKIPQPTVFALRNGIKVYLLEDHELPLVRGAALVRTGNLFDEKERLGLAEVAGSTIRSGGTKTLTGDQLDEKLESIAASIESNIGETSGRVGFSCLKDNTDAVLGLFKDVLTGPEFRQEKIDLVLTQLRSAISRRNDEASAIASREFSRLVYGRNTPYGEQIEYETLAHIGRPDVVNFYKRYFFPSNIMLSVYGDFSTEEMKQKLEKLFGDWTVEQPKVPAFPEVEKTARPGVYFASKPDVTQTFFELGHLGGTLIDADFAALSVAADVLGGGFSSRLVREVRSRLGYAYSIYSSWSADYDHPGVFRIGGSTKSKSTTETMEVIFRELQKMRTDEITDQELKTAKDSVLNGLVFAFERPSSTLNRIVLYDYFDYPRDFLSQYQKAIAAVTKADVLRVAKKYFEPEKMTIVAVGNEKDFDKPLSALNRPVHPIDLTIPQPKTQEVKADPQSLAKGKQLLTKVADYMGGAPALESVKDFSETADAEIQSPQGAMKIKQIMQVVRSGAIRQEQQLPVGTITMFADGKAGWVQSPQGSQELPPPVAQQMKQQANRQLLDLIAGNLQPNAKVNYAGNGVLALATEDGQNISLTVDEATGMPVKLAYQDAGTPNEVKFSDWRAVGGLKLPFKREVVRGGSTVANSSISEYKVNSGLRAEDLGKKP